MPFGNGSTIASELCLSGMAFKAQSGPRVSHHLQDRLFKAVSFRKIQRRDVCLQSEFAAGIRVGTVPDQCRDVVEALRQGLVPTPHPDGCPVFARLPVHSRMVPFALVQQLMRPEESTPHIACFHHSIVQRGLIVFVPGIRFRSAFQQKCQRGRVALLSGKVQGSVACHWNPSIWIGAMPKQQCHRQRMPDGRVQGPLAFTGQNGDPVVLRPVRTRTESQKHAHCVEVAGPCRHVERRVSEYVSRGRIRKALAARHEVACHRSHFARWDRPPNPAAVRWSPNPCR